MKAETYQVYVYPAAEGHPGMVELRAFRGGDAAIIMPVSIMALAKLSEDVVSTLADYLRKHG